MDGGALRWEGSPRRGMPQGEALVGCPELLSTCTAAQQPARPSPSRPAHLHLLGPPLLHQEQQLRAAHAGPAPRLDVRLLWGGARVGGQ